MNWVASKTSLVRFFVRIENQFSVLFYSRTISGHNRPLQRISIKWPVDNLTHCRPVTMIFFPSPVSCYSTSRHPCTVRIFFTSRSNILLTVRLVSQWHRFSYFWPIVRQLLVQRLLLISPAANSSARSTPEVTDYSSVIRCNRQKKTIASFWRH